nr:MAG TPA: hypothetical protein [Crassvirales sp.]
MAKKVKSVKNKCKAYRYNSNRKPKIQNFI